MNNIDSKMYVVDAGVPMNTLSALRSAGEYGTQPTALMVEVKQEDEKETDVRRMVRGRIDPLGDTNYATWAMAMELVLDDFGLWNEKLNVPIEGKRSWKEIVYQLKTSQYVYVERVKCGLDAWKALAKIHEKAGMAAMNMEMKNFLNSKLNGGMREHLSDIVARQRKLQRMGLEISDDITKGVILNSLPDRYDPLVMALDVVGASEITVEDLITKLNNLKPMDDSEVALATVPTCYFCRQPGHLKRNCWKWKNKKREEIEEDSLEALITSYKNPDDNWNLDSGASCHFTGDHRNLTTYKTVKDC